jgi:hypothetical protein
VTAQGPETPDPRAETIIGEVLAGDLAEQQVIVEQRRTALALGRRYHRRDRNEMIRLESAVGVAERHLATLARRQADWNSDRTFERDLVDRVLLLARIADFREVTARAGDALRSVGIAVTQVGEVRATADERRVVTNVAAVLDYLRRHHPPVY